MADDSAETRWETEPEQEPGVIDAPNINPAMPKEMWDTLVWGALRVIFPVVETEEEAWEKAGEWNSQNNPPLPAKRLATKVSWALRTWDHNLKKKK